MADHDVVCAIDFGTTFSGFAYSQTGDPEKVYIKNDWGDIAGISGATKTPTTILITPNGKVKIGYDAMKEYTDLSSTGSKDVTNCRYYEKFKMKLYEKDAGKLTADTKIIDQAGRPQLALDVFGKVLHEMRALFLEKYDKQFMGKAEDSKVLWVVTVPAIWTDAAKQFMKEAAAKGGLVDDAESDKLAIALEPESASIMCQTLPIESYSSTAGSAEMSVGTQFLVLDAGGGTLDITVHEVLSNRELQEVYFVSGTAAGGAQIDARFIQLMDTMFEKPFMQKFKKKNPAGFFDFMQKFEPSKRAFGPGAKALSVTVPAGMTELYADEYGPQLRHAIKKEYADKGVTSVGGILRIPHDVIMGIFTPTVSKIVGYVKELLGKDELKKVSTILMVGGLSCSKIMQGEIKKEFGGKYNVIIPEDAASVVVQGASIFGHRLNAIKSRIARKTYGARIVNTYDPEKHENAQIDLRDGILKALNIFDPFIQRGERVTNDSCFTKTYHPSKKNQTNITFLFFATSSKDAKYTTEDGMEEIGKLRIDLPGSGRDRDVEVTMKFGGTNIAVEGRDKRSNESVKTTLDFLSK